MAGERVRRGHVGSVVSAEAGMGRDGEQPVVLGVVYVMAGGDVRVGVFAVGDISGSGYFRVRVFQGQGISGSGYLRVKYI